MCVCVYFWFCSLKNSNILCLDRLGFIPTSFSNSWWFSWSAEVKSFDLPPVKFYFNENVTYINSNVSIIKLKISVEFKKFKIM